jgi:hypothetical protein
VGRSRALQRNPPLVRMTTLDRLEHYLRNWYSVPPVARSSTMRRYQDHLNHGWTYYIDLFDGVHRVLTIVNWPVGAAAFVVEWSASKAGRTVYGPTRDVACTAAAVEAALTAALREVSEAKVDDG